MQLLSLFTLFAAFLRVALADVSITEPTSGDSYSGSSGTATFTVSWVDSTTDDDDDFSLSKVSLYAIVLCAGSNSAIKAVKSLTTSLLSSKLEYDVSLDASDVPDGNYFIQVYAKFSSGYSIHYSPRFTLEDMTGETSTLTFSASILSITGTQPSAQLANTGTTDSIDSALFTVPYTEQTGKTRYAPMQTQPGSSISYKLYSTRHATSAYTPYSTLLPSPNVYSTITPGWSYSVTSLMNSASVAGVPSYYYPASSRVVSATLSAAKKKRWI